MAELKIIFSSTQEKRLSSRIEYSECLANLSKASNVDFCLGAGVVREYNLGEEKTSFVQALVLFGLNEGM